MSLIATYDLVLSPAGAARPAIPRGPRQVSDVELRLKALMLLALDGDAAASNALLTALAPPLRRYFARRLGQGAAEIEDLVQETLIAVHTKRHTYDAHQPLTPWVYAIARYRLADHFRRSRRRGETPLDDAGDLIDPGDFDAAEARRDLARLLEALPERQRRLVMDVKVEGRSIEETSAKTGLSQSAVKVAVHRAVNALAKRFRDANG
jgi:RNA polymerase sigma-70 factor (ECF subfamily)